MRITCRKQHINGAGLALLLKRYDKCRNCVEKKTVFKYISHWLFFRGCLWFVTHLPRDGFISCCSTWMHAIRLSFQHFIRGRPDKYLAYKRKTKILELWRFISQHSLLLARYTSPSDAPTSLTRMINTFSGGLQSKPPWRPTYLLIRLKFLPGEWLSQVWKQKEVKRGQIGRIWWTRRQFVA